MSKQQSTQKDKKIEKLSPAKTNSPTQNSMTGVGQMPKSKPDKKRVEFVFRAPKAKEVSLMGDFNQWKEKSSPMNHSAVGVWETAMMLSPGRYEYKFLVDGKWKLDPDNRQVCVNCFGTQNNVMTV